MSLLNSLLNQNTSFPIFSFGQRRHFILETSDPLWELNWGVSGARSTNPGKQARGTLWRGSGRSKHQEHRTSQAARGELLGAVQAR